MCIMANEEGLEMTNLVIIQYEGFGNDQQRKNIFFKRNY